MRLFTAVELPEAIKDKVLDLLEQFKKLDPNQKYTSRENLHITLKFFGELSENDADKLVKSLSDLRFKPFDCSLSSVGAFPDKDEPRVVWLGVDTGKLELEMLFAEIDKRTRDFASEARTYHPHITLFRSNGYLTSRKLFHSDFKTESFKVSEFLIIKSVLSPKGPVYSVFKRLSLKN